MVDRIGKFIITACLRIFQTTADEAMEFRTRKPPSKERMRGLMVAAWSCGYPWTRFWAAR